MQLVRYEAARRALAEARTVDEAKVIKDKAEALRAYARQAKDIELETWAAEIKLRAQRELGRRSKMLDRSKGGRNPKATLPAGRKSKVAVLQDVNISTSAAARYEQLAKVPDETFEAAIAKAAERKQPVTMDVFVKAARGSVKAERLNEQWSNTSKEGLVKDLAAFASGDTKCGCIYADPPWLYGNQGTRAATGGHYKGLSFDEICALPVADCAAEKAHLHLWTTNAFLPLAFEVIDAWGFTYKSMYVWVKPQMGIGNYWRVSHEFLMLGVRGSLTFADKAQQSWGQFKRGSHSAKPERIRDIIERVSPPPRLELFARTGAPDWLYWGNEANNLFTRQNHEFSPDDESGIEVAGDTSAVP